MRILRLILIAVVVFVLQVTFVHKVSIWGATPDLMIVFLVLLTLDMNPVAAVIVGFLFGFLMDLGNALFLGMNALALSIIAYGVSHLGGGYLPENALFKSLVIFAASLVKDLVVLIITTAFSLPDVFFMFFRYSLLSALYSAVLGILILGLLSQFRGRMVRSGVRF